MELILFLLTNYSFYLPQNISIFKFLISNLRKVGDNSTSLSTVFDEVKRRIQGIKKMGIGFKIMKQMLKSQDDEIEIEEINSKVL
jgi:hypothetical protein